MCDACFTSLCSKLAARCTSTTSVLADGITCSVRTAPFGVKILQHVKNAYIVCHNVKSLHTAQCSAIVADSCTHLNV
jgi:hypothetical protein